MKIFQCFALAALAMFCVTMSAPQARASQVTVNIGTAPNCPYGYYDYSPYDCAPYGYYGPEWFANGVFIGAGPWFHGPHDFRGHVDNRFDVQHGYHGARPNRGDRPEASKPPGRISHFQGNEERDGRGHVTHR